MELAERDKLIEDNIRLVRYFTGKYARKLAGKLDYDEVYSAANFGIVQAANAYEPERGTFSTYVGLCIWHRCLRDLRDKRKEAHTVSLDATLPGDIENITLADVVPDTRADFEEVVADKDRLERFLAILTPEERKLILNHANGVTQIALGKQLNVSQAQVSRMLKAIQRKEGTVVTIQRPLDREEFMERVSYDLEKAKERSNKKVMEKPAKPSVADRAAVYNAARAEGMNPDEAAQAAGWKNFNSAKTNCCKNGIKISTKAPTVEAAQPRKAAVINQNFDDAFNQPGKPAAALIPDRMEPVIEPDKPRKRTLRPCSWEGKDFLYTDNGDCIEITPYKGSLIQLTPDALKQFSEEINELLEVIKHEG